MATAVSPVLQSNMDALKAELGNSMDVVYREFTTGQHGGRAGFLVFLDGMVDGARVEALIRSLLELTNPPFEQPPVSADPALQIDETTIQAAETQTLDDMDDVVDAILRGQTALFLEGAGHAVAADTRKPPGRGVEEPSTEAEVRGPRDGLTEDLLVNVALVRRRIRNPKLRIEGFSLGRRTQTDVAIAYIEGLAEPTLVDEVRRRINSIKTDAVLGTGYIEEWIQDNPLSPFGAMNYTERPDKLAGNLLEGLVAVLGDNSPFALLAPTTFWQFLQAPGDYYQSPLAATAYRWLRLLAMVVALTLPSLYTILASYHHEMIPTPLALSMAAGHEGTPFPTLLEVLGMSIMFEVMHEAGLRLPRAVGQTVSIVGALVIGEAAVQAGLVAPTTVIVVATAGITGFAIPSYAASLSIRLLRMPLLVLSGALGVFGFIAGTALMAMHAASLRSFGQPFLSPIAPLHPREVQDTLVRAPWWALDWRPHLVSGRPTRRQPAGQRPGPPRGSGGGRP